MANESGEWIMHGVAWDDPSCIHTIDEAIKYINEIGFLPLFKNSIEGFSLEERVVADYWWSGDVERDPWVWREIIARQGNIAYGKFFDKKAGFISREWLPYFVNFRRDGYDFDALWDDQKASLRQKKLMDLFTEENADNELFSFEMKKLAGFGKGGEKNFDGTVCDLMMSTYLVMRDFARRKNKKGEEYGWNVAKYSTPEHLFGRDYITKAYEETPEISKEKIYSHVRRLFPNAEEKQIKKLLR